jgi:hypothetical protein
MSATWSAVKNVDLTSLSVGVHVLTLHVTNTNGNTASVSQPFFLDAQGNVTPVTGTVGYPHFVPQPAIDVWQWLDNYAAGFGATFEGMPHLNINNGTETGEAPYLKDVEYGIKGTQWRQYNPAWLADQEDPPTVDPTTANKLMRLVAVLGLQEQLTGTTVNQTNTDAALKDADGNDLGPWLYMFDLDRPTGDDPGGNAALRVGAMSDYGAPLVPITMNIGWESHGRGQGMACENGNFTRGDGTSSDDATKGAAQLWRQAVDANGNPTGDWQLCGSFSPDVTGRFRTNPQPEGGANNPIGSPEPCWQYKTNGWQGVFVTREYAFCQITTVLQHPWFFEGVANRLYGTGNNAGKAMMLRQMYGGAWHSDTSALAATWPALAYLYPVWRGAMLCQTTGGQLELCQWADDGNNWQPTSYPIMPSLSYPCPVYINAGLIGLGGYDGGSHKFLRWDWYAQAVKDVVTVAAGDDAPGAVAMNSGRGQYVYAVPSGGNLLLYTSRDGGQTWQAGPTVANLAYPSLDLSNVSRWYLAGYDTVNHNAALERWDYLPTMARRSDGRLTVGAADADRVAIVRRAGLCDLLAIAVSGGHFVAYRSQDDGAAWDAGTVIV